MSNLNSYLSLNFSIVLALVINSILFTETIKKPTENKDQKVDIVETSYVTYQEARELGTSLIKKFEGFRSKEYICYGGKSTIGYGFTRTNKTSMTKTEADQMLINVYDRMHRSIWNKLKHDITEPQMAALISLGYNIGIYGLYKSTLFQKIQEGNFNNDTISEEFKKYVYARNQKTGQPTILKGLEKRRNAEIELFAMCK